MHWDYGAGGKVCGACQHWRTTVHILHWLDIQGCGGCESEVALLKMLTKGPGGWCGSLRLILVQV